MANTKRKLISELTLIWHSWSMARYLERILSKHRSDVAHRKTNHAVNRTEQWCGNSRLCCRNDGSIGYIECIELECVTINFQQHWRSHFVTGCVSGSTCNQQLITFGYFWSGYFCSVDLYCWRRFWNKIEMSCNHVTKNNATRLKTFSLDNLAKWFGHKLWSLCWFSGV